MIYIFNCETFVMIKVYKKYSLENFYQREKFNLTVFHKSIIHVHYSHDPTLLNYDDEISFFLK